MSKEARNKFYKSSRWIHLRDRYAKDQDYICERCQRVCWRKGDKGFIEARRRGEDVVFGIVHHKIHLNSDNYNDPSISLNWNNLEYLCITCHNKEHINSLNKGIPEVREDVKFDDNGNIII